MSHEQDLTFLDTLEILRVLFPIAYSPYFQPDTSGDSAITENIIFIEVDKDVKIGCGFWPVNKKSPSILYFHGNGETVGDYSYSADFYNKNGINLFVADYRGYGVSNGKPTVTNMISDSHKIFKSFQSILKEKSFRPSLFLMGRSLGSIPAVEIAYHYQDRLRGLIIDSGTLYNFRQLWSYLESTESKIQSGSIFQNRAKMKSIEIPTCIIHGDNDQIIPAEEAIDLYKNSAALEKDIHIISGAGHNDLLAVAHEQYFSIIGEFVTNADKMLE